MGDFLLVCLFDAASNKNEFNDACLYVSVPRMQFNFVGKLLGPKGNSLKRLQEETLTKMAILGRGSMRDKNKVRLLTTPSIFLTFIRSYFSLSLFISFIYCSLSLSLSLFLSLSLSFSSCCRWGSLWLLFDSLCDLCDHIGPTCFIGEFCFWRGLSVEDSLRIPAGCLLIVWIWRILLTDFEWWAGIPPPRIGMLESIHPDYLMVINDSPGTTLHIHVDF